MANNLINTILKLYLNHLNFFREVFIFVVCFWLLYIFESNYFIIYKNPHVQEDK